MHKVALVVKTQLGLERIAASYLKESLKNCKFEVNPKGFKGLILVYSDLDPKELYDKAMKIPEVERAIPIYATTSSNLDDILKAGLSVAKKFLSNDEKFAVRCVRRGSHSYTSLEVNSSLGGLILNEIGCKVDLENPDKVVAVEIVDDLAAIGVVEGLGKYVKMTPNKVPIYEYMKYVTVGQVPYLGSDEALVMGEKVGRAVQSFEVSRYIITIMGPTPWDKLGPYVKGVNRGIRSRYEIQKRSYGRGARRTKVEISSLFELVRGWEGKIVIFEPEGRPFPEVGERIGNWIRSREEVLLLLGSREGVPSGIFRFADLVVDLCPGITLATEVAVSSALTAVSFSIQGEGLEQA